MNSSWSYINRGNLSHHRICAPMSCCQVARPCSKGLVHDERIDGEATPTMKVMVVAPPENALRIDWRIDLVFPQHIPRSATLTSARICTFMLHGGTTMFREIGERMIKDLTVLSPSTMRSRWLLHLCKSTQYGLEGLPCSSQHIPADADPEGEYHDLARS